jgi:hypothetical protein
MVNASLISRLSHAVDVIERRRQQNWKVVKVRRGFQENPDAARARHFAAHPEDRDANIVIFEFFDHEEIADGARTVLHRAKPAEVKNGLALERRGAVSRLRKAVMRRLTT